MPQLLPADTISAACRGELQLVIEWLTKGGHIDALDRGGYGLLHGAATGGQLRVAKELLQRGASVDLRGTGGITALMGAVAEGRHAIVRLLLEHKASTDLQEADEMTALMMAACKGRQECVQELLQAGASTALRDQGGITALQIAAGNGHAAIAKLLRQHAATPPASVATSLPHEVGDGGRDRRRRPSRGSGGAHVHHLRGGAARGALRVRPRHGVRRLPAASGGAVPQVPDVRRRLRRAASGGARRARAHSADVCAAEVI